MPRRCSSQSTPQDEKLTSQNIKCVSKCPQSDLLVFNSRRRWDGATMYVWATCDGDANYVARTTSRESPSSSGTTSRAGNGKIVVLLWILRNITPQYNFAHLNGDCGSLSAPARSLFPFVYFFILERAVWERMSNNFRFASSPATSMLPSPSINPNTTEKPHANSRSSDV